MAGWGGSARQAGIEKRMGRMAEGRDRTQGLWVVRQFICGKPPANAEGARQSRCREAAEAGIDRAGIGEQLLASMGIGHCRFLFDSKVSNPEMSVSHFARALSFEPTESLLGTDAHDSSRI